MPSILPPPTPTQPDAGPTNELSELAAFIASHAATEFDRHLAVLLRETSAQHDAWAMNCQVSHFHDEVPCDEFERGISLGIAWLKARIKDGAPDGS